jgi:hypothetical protein
MNWTASLLRNQLAKARKEHRAKIDSLTTNSKSVSRFRELQREKQQLITEKQKVQQDLSLTQQNITNLEAEIQAKEQALVTKDTDLAQQQQQNLDQIRSLEKDFRHYEAYHQREIARFRKEKQEAIKDLTKQNKALQILANHRLELLEQEKTALITLAKQKISNKKEASELVKQLEERFTKEKEDLISEHGQEIDKLTSDRDQKDQSFKNAYELWQRHEKAAEYLKDKLNGAEKALEETKQELAETKEQIQKQEQDHAEVFEAKEQELTKRQETLAIIQQRNTDLQGQLANKDSEISKLTEWINRLETASAEGNAWEQLQAELKQNQQTITSLQEQLALKYPNKHYWVYALVAIVIIYLALK